VPLRSHTRQHTGKRAFTLIELLVVIAIIALLIGLLLPALKSARAAGRSIACLSNQRSIISALALYADDFKRIVPRECGTSNLSIPAVPLNSTPALTAAERVTLSWSFNLRPYIDPRASAQDKTGGMNDDRFVSAPYYHDPARPRDQHTVHYVNNGFRFSAPGIPAGTKPPSPLDLVRSPSQTIYLTCFNDDADELRAKAWFNASSSTLQVSQFYDTWSETHLKGSLAGPADSAATAQRIAPLRHGSTSNAAFFDSHAVAVSPDAVTNLNNWNDGDYR
jgi:prepilin-type N-terminal cleavage/methylation domain-containing protein/prepilin-type processing-associated H-X9-DG protein